MTPSAPDHDIVGRRLRLLVSTLAELADLGHLDAGRLAGEPVTRAATERYLQVLVDLAVEINAHLLVAVRGVAPVTGRESFLAMGEVGILPDGLAERLAPAAGLRNILVHRYVDIDSQLVAEARRDLLDLMPGYVHLVAAFLDAAGGEP